MGGGGGAHAAPKAWRALTLQARQDARYNGQLQVLVLGQSSSKVLIGREFGQAGLQALTLQAR